MPLKIRDLGYTLAPGERFADESDCVDDDEGPELKNFAKSEINREKEIRDKIDDLKLKPVKGDKEVPWVETLTVVGDTACDQNLDKNKSLDLENHFKELSSTFVKTGLKKLQKLNLPFNRPSDFYAEMMKSDEHMNRITKNLERKQKEESDRKALLKAKRNKKQKKFSRKVLESQEKNKFIKNVNLLKKKLKGEDMDKQIDKLISTPNTNNKSNRNKSKNIKNFNDNNKNSNIDKRKLNRLINNTNFSKSSNTNTNSNNTNTSNKNNRVNKGNKKVKKNKTKNKSKSNNQNRNKNRNKKRNKK